MPGRSKPPKYIIGLDLGQQRDYTAISVIDRSEDRDGQEPELRVRHLERFREVLYPDVADRVEGLLENPLLAGQSSLVIDQTGVGPAVGDIFRKRGLAYTAVQITGGDSVTVGGGAVRVPKRNLVYSLVAAFQQGTLKIARGLELAEVLKSELLNFKIKVNIATGHDSYEAWREGDHDDLVLATALACWKASVPPRPRFRVTRVGRRGRGAG